jgi:hypothetical protein
VRTTRRRNRRGEMPGMTRMPVGDACAIVARLLSGMMAGLNTLAERQAMVGKGADDQTQQTPAGRCFPQAS